MDDLGEGARAMMYRREGPKPVREPGFILPMFGCGCMCRIASKGKGKGGGARVVFLPDIYDKSEQANISEKELPELLKMIDNS